MAAAALSTLAAVGGARGDTFTWSNAAGGFTWGTASNWSPAGVPGAADTAILTSAGVGTIGLGGQNWQLDTLRYATGSQSNRFDISNTGSLTLNRIQVTNYTDPGSNGIYGAVNAAASTLTVDLTGGSLNLSGKVSAQNLVVNNSGSQHHLDLRGTANEITGMVTINGGAALQLYGLKSLGSTPSPVVLNSGRLEVWNSVNAQYFNTITVNGTSSIGAYPGASNLQPNFGALSIGSSTLSLGGAALSFSSVTLTGNPTFWTSSSSDTPTLGAINGGAFGFTKTGSGNLKLESSGNFSGPVNINEGMITVTTPAGGLGTGSVNIAANGLLKFAAAQTVLPKITVPAGAGIGGNLTGAIYSGPNRNITLADGAILFPDAGPVPVRGVDCVGAPYLIGLVNPTGNYTLGDDGKTGVFKAAVIGAFSPSFTGSLNEVTPGTGYELRVLTTNATLSGITFNTTNTTTGVTISSVSAIAIGAKSTSTASVFTVKGDPTNQNRVTAQVLGKNAVAAGKRWQIGDGVAIAWGSSRDQVQTGGELDINAGGTLYVEQGSFTSGTYKINPGGAVAIASYYNKQSAPYSLAGGANFDFSDGSLLILHDSMNTGAVVSTWLPRSGADIIVKTYYDQYSVFSGSGIVLSEGKRLTNSLRSAYIGAGAGISAFPEASKVLITTNTFGAMDIHDNVNLAGKTLQINDTGTFTTVSESNGNGDHFYQRTVANQSGIVRLLGNVTAGTLLTKAGTLTLGNQTTDTFTFGALQLDGGSTSMFAGNFNVAGPVTFNGGSLSITTGATFGGLILQGANNSIPANVPLSGNVALTGDVVKTGTAPLTLSALTNFRGQTRTYNVSGGDLTVSGTIINGSVNKTGDGTLVLNGAAGYTGSTTVQRGRVSINSDAKLGNPPAAPTEGHLLLDGGTLLTTATFSLNGNRGVRIGGNGGGMRVSAGTTFTVPSVISGDGKLTKSGTGTLVLSGSNSFDGDVDVLEGLLRVTGSLQNSVDIFVAAGAAYERAIAPGGSYAGVGLSVASELATNASILDGTNTSGVAKTIGLKIRQRTPADPHLTSDVIDLTGLLGDTYVLEMTYDPDRLYTREASERQQAEAGLIYLITKGVVAWDNAVDTNTAGTPTFAGVGAYDGQKIVGRWGVDLDRHAVWAVLDHNSEFAVVPEPAGLTATLAAASLLLRRRRAR
jgi:fibronectin-binding autotransporter adhesin